MIIFTGTLDAPFAKKLLDDLRKIHNPFTFATTEEALEFYSNGTQLHGSALDICVIGSPTYHWTKIAKIDAVPGAYQRDPKHDQVARAYGQAIQVLTQIPTFVVSLTAYDLMYSADAHAQAIATLYDPAVLHCAGLHVRDAEVSAQGVLNLAHSYFSTLNKDHHA